MIAGEQSKDRKNERQLCDTSTTAAGDTEKGPINPIDSITTLETYSKTRIFEKRKSLAVLLAYRGAVASHLLQGHDRVSSFGSHCICFFIKAKARVINLSFYISCAHFTAIIVVYSAESLHKFETRH